MADTDNIHKAEVDEQVITDEPADRVSTGLSVDNRHRIPHLHRKYLECAPFLGVNCSPGEKIHMFIRRHWLFELLIAGQGFLLAGVPVIIWLWASPLLGDWQLITLLALMIYIQFALLFTFKHWLDFYLDVIVVTNRKIVDIDQVGFFNRRISETSLARIQDAAGRLQGLIGTLLKFGTVEIQTAGQESKFELDRVGHPVETAAAIEQIQAEYLATMSGSPAEKEQILAEL